MKSVIKYVWIGLMIPMTLRAQKMKEPAIEHVRTFPPDTFGMYFNLYVGNRMPFTDASVPGPDSSILKGRFLLDFGTDTTVIDPHGFTADTLALTLNHQYSITFINGVYYGPYIQYCNIQPCDKFAANGITESGIIGTDILSQIVVTLDYQFGRLYLNWDTTNCGKPDIMRHFGFVPVSTKGFYKNHRANVPNHNNNPMIPIIIGDSVNSAEAVAFIDPGYDDRCYVLKDVNTYYTHIININKHYLLFLQEKGVEISVDKNSYYTLDNISGKPDTLFKCSFAQKYKFNAVGLNDETVIPYSTDQCNVFLKVNAPGGESAGGITTYDFPAAQFGGSILMDCAQVTFDPFRSLVWFRQGE